MSSSHPWAKLDNAAKIFPPTANTKDPKVFCLICELKEQVDETILQSALLQTLDNFPWYQSVLKRGAFWYYLEKSDLTAQVKKAQNAPCAPLYNPDYAQLLFAVTYDDNRINLEVFHVLADGNGALQFLKNLIVNYVAQKYHYQNKNKSVAIFQDDFQKYLGKQKTNWLEKKTRAYKIKGKHHTDGNLVLMENKIDLKQALKKAHAYDATLGEYLCAVFIVAIGKQMKKHEEKRPIVLLVPVDFRRFFPSNTVRNFFSTIKIRFCYQKENGDFAKIIKAVKTSFEKQLTAQNMQKNLDHYSSFARNYFVKPVPLFLKVLGLRMIQALADNLDTAVFSNLGKIDLPPSVASKIKSFSFFASTTRLHMDVCSFGNVLTVNFSSPLMNNTVQNNFLAVLKNQNIKVETTTLLPIRKKVSARQKLLNWFFLGSVLTALICVMINLLVPKSGGWSIFVVAGMGSLWLSILLIINKRRNLIKTLLWQFLVVGVLVLVWDMNTGWHGWSYNFVLPIVTSATMLSMLLIAKIQKLSANDYLFYLIILTVIGLFSFILILTHTVTIWIPTAICWLVATMMLAILLSFESKTLLSELKRRFHL